jgi:hypothetical protein
MAFVRADEFQFGFLLLSLLSVFQSRLNSGQVELQFRAEGFQIPQHRKALFVIGNPIATPYDTETFTLQGPKFLID